MEADPISGGAGLSASQMMTQLNKLPQQAQLQQVAQEFEAIFVRQFLGESLKPIIKGIIGEDSASSGIYQQLIVDSLAGGISRGGGFGLSSTLQLQLQQPGAMKGAAE